MSMSVSRALSTLTCVAALSCSAFLFAQGQDAKSAIQARHDNFEAIGDAFKVIRDQIRGDRDVAAITKAAQEINDLSLEVKNWFPAGSGPESGIETEALAAIWEDSAGFAKAADAFPTAAAEMLAAAKSGDIAKVGANVRTLGGSCKNCHDNYRLDKD